MGRSKLNYQPWSKLYFFFGGGEALILLEFTGGSYLSYADNFYFFDVDVIGFKLDNIWIGYKIKTHVRE